MRSTSRSGLAPRQRFLARRIVASTQRLVGQAMHRHWHRMPALMAERRALLAQLQAQHGDEHEASCARALRAAVTESDRLLHGMLIAGLSQSGD